MRRTPKNRSQSTRSRLAMAHPRPGLDLEALEPRKLLSHTSGLDHVLVMPEGFSAPSVVEVVELAFADDSGSADWELWAHYERDGAGEEVARIAQGTLAAGQSTSVAVWGEGAALVRADEPYALVLRTSTDDLTALLRHGDFGAQTAQYFTEASSSSFVLPGVRRDDDSARDFVVFYNGGDDDARVELELRDDSGNTFRYSSSVGGQRRGGWSLQELPGLPEGVYQARVTSDSAIVLGGTRYAVGRQSATIELPAQTTARAGAILDVEFDGGGTSNDDTFLFIANPGESDVQVRFRAFRDDDGPLPGPATFTVTISAGESTRVSLRDRGYTDDDDSLSLAYVADAPVALNAITERRGQLVFAQPQTLASEAWFFDRGLVEEVEDDEVETEDVVLFNPTGSAVQVTVTFTFSDGTRIIETKSLASLEVEDVDGRLRADRGFTLPTGGLDFTITVESTGPIVAMLEHWNRLGRSAENTSLGVPTGTVSDLVDIAVF